MRRALPLALLALSALGWLGLVAPAQRERDQARADYAQARQERERLRGELARAPGRTRPSLVADEAAAGRALRLTLLRATEGLPVAVAQLSATGERGGVQARGHLSVEGELADLLQVAERLVDPAAGLRVERVVLSPAGGVDEGGARLEIDGSTLVSGA